MKTLQVGSFAVNCTLIERNGGVWIVDPGSEGDRIAAAVESTGLEPLLVLLTHGHFDHIGAIPELQRRFAGLRVYVHPLDAAILDHELNCYPPDYPGIKRPANICDARELEGVTVIETPGHTPGGCCYLFDDERLMFTGDTLFAGSVGRTDLPGGDMATLRKSLAKLLEIKADCSVIPGHGPFTTLAREKSDNPFFSL